MSDIRRLAVTHDVGCPLVFGRVGVPGTDVSRLKRFKVLQRAEFIGHFGVG